MSQLPTICLIHGHGVDASIWDSIYADLALDHAVLTPDFARLSTLTTIESYADELYDVLQAANVEKAVLVGHSMGGYMALALAEKYPKLVQGLVLYHSTATADDDAKREARQQVINALQAEGTAPFIQKQMPKMVAPRSFAISMAAIVSAVSPDCEMAITTSFSVIIGFLYLNSEAYSTSTGILAYSSIRYSPTRPACQEVPQATIMIRSMFLSLSAYSLMPPSCTNPSLG